MIRDPPSIYHTDIIHVKNGPGLPPPFCILQAIKHWMVGRPGNEASQMVHLAPTVPPAYSSHLFCGRQISQERMCRSQCWPAVQQWVGLGVWPGHVTGLYWSTLQVEKATSTHNTHHRQYTLPAVLSSMSFNLALTRSAGVYISMASNTYSVSGVDMTVHVRHTMSLYPGMSFDQSLQV